MLRLDANGYEERHVAFAAGVQECELPSHAVSELVTDFENRFPDRCVPMDGMLETLSALQERGVPLGLITNGSTVIQTRKIELLGLSKFFRCIVISEAFGARKPDPAIFIHTTDCLGVEPSEALYVGDNPGADVHGANLAGLVSVWMEDPFFAPPESADHRISELGEILAILEVFG